MSISRIVARMLGVGWGLLFVAGCSKSSGPTGAVGDTTPGGPAGPPGVLAPISATQPSTSGGGDPALSIAERFKRESSSRPTGSPRVEDATAAFANAGVKLNELKQHLASPIGARYCVGATTEAGVSMSICEYTDAAAANAGRDASAKAFAAIKNRDIYVNKATTLTLLLSPRTSASEAQATKLREAFSKLP